MTPMKVCTKKSKAWWSGMTWRLPVGTLPFKPNYYSQSAKSRFLGAEARSE